MGDCTLPRVSLTLPENLVQNLDELQRRKLEITLVDMITAVGERFKTKLDISGQDDIWAHAQTKGFSNKASVFGTVYMIPKPCRTDEVIAEFGGEIEVTICRVVKKFTGKDCGIDLPIRVVPRHLYIERDDKPHAG